MRCQYWLNKQLRSTIAEPAFARTVDVVVAGLGTAGGIAAYVAARRGLRVLGIERSTGMGGQGGMSGVVDYFYGTRGGAAEDINQLCKDAIARGEYVGSVLPTATEESLPPAVKSRFLEQECLKHGAEIWYDAQVLGIYMEGNRLCGVRCAYGDAIMQVACRVLIDATGEADIAHMANCPMLPMRETDGNSLLFSKVNAVLCYENCIRGGWRLNGRIDCSDAESFSESLLHASAVQAQNRPEHDGGRTVFEGVLPGVREGRRIDAEETLSLPKFMAGYKTDTPLYYSAANVDNVNRDLALEDDTLQDFQMIATLSRSRVVVGIPMGALLPRNVEGLLVAGRCMGTDHDFASGIRMKRDIEKSGEAAATWAELAIHGNMPLRKVEYAVLAEELRKTGCLDESQNMPWVDAQVLRDTGCYEPIAFPETEAEIFVQMSTQDAGRAYWALRAMGKNALPMLERRMRSDNALTVRNSAIAAGILGGEFAIPELRRISHDFTQHPDAKMYSVHYPDCMKALTLLARMGDVESLPWMLEILENPHIADAFPQRQDTYAPEPTDFYTNLFLHALCGMRRILFAHPEKREEYVPRILRRIFDDDFCLYHSFGDVTLTKNAREVALSI